jgi:geranylgeranyl diphosphate synthase type II
VSLHGLDGARRRGDELVDRAIRALAVFDAAAEPLRAIARFIMDRRT